MSTNYPNSVDGVSQIRLASDGITEILGADHNDLRSAIIAIEQTLGINPQGVFGTVVARLNDAYSNIESHVAGDPPRHADTVIQSAVRTGATPGSVASQPYSLSSGTVGSQLAQLLVDLNDVAMYGGSGATTFADGTSLSLSSIRTTITSIISQLGSGTSGTTKISGATITGTTYTVVAGTLRSQLVALLTLIDNLSLTSGGNNIGLTPFNSNRFAFSSTTAQDGVEEIVNYLDENVNLLHHAYSSYVISGVGVTEGAVASGIIASGYVSINGRHIYYGGSTFTTRPAGTWYVYLTETLGVLSATVSSSSTISSIKPQLLLIKLVSNGTSWTSSTDLRRFGNFSNNKNCFTVGNNTDGYGYDFSSLGSAIELLKIYDANSIIAPKLIKLSSNIVETSTTTIDVSGLIIDGNGFKITFGVDVPVFLIEANRVMIRNLTVESNLLSAGSSACFALLGVTNSISEIKVENCSLITNGNFKFPYFLNIGNVGGTTQIYQCTISNNLAIVDVSAIYVNFDEIFLYNTIENNYFTYDDPLNYSPWVSYGTQSLIQTGWYSKIINNLLVGPFSIAIEMDGSNSVISNNTIIGGEGTVGTPAGCLLSNGIICGALTIDNIVSKNYIYGCRNIAIQNSGLTTDNIINNKYNFLGTTNSFIGIGGLNSLSSCVTNNTIYSTGFPIYQCSKVTGNLIINDSTFTSTLPAIEYATSIDFLTIKDNMFYNVPNYTLSVDGAAYQIEISNNIFYGSTASLGAIYALRGNSIVSNNYITGYLNGIRFVSSAVSNSIIKNNIMDLTITGNYAINTNGIKSNITICDNTISAGKVGIDLNDSTNCNVFNNTITQIESGVSGDHAIMDAGSYSKISNNSIINANDSAIYISGGDNISVCGNTITGGTAVPSIYFFDSVNNSSISDNNISSNDGYGIFVNNSSVCKISNNTINSCGLFGIYSRNSLYFKISDNIISTCEYPGIYSTGVYNLQFINNNVSVCGNTLAAQIFVGDCADVMVSGNLITSPPAGALSGLKATSIQRCLISNNLAAGVDYGISLYDITDYVMVGNFSSGATPPSGFDALDIGEHNGYIT
jgi:parallel beta-helix repeat protein